MCGEEAVSLCSCLTYMSRAAKHTAAPPAPPPPDRRTTTTTRTAHLAPTTHLTKAEPKRQGQAAAGASNGLLVDSAVRPAAVASHARPEAMDCQAQQAGAAAAGNPHPAANTPTPRTAARLDRHPCMRRQNLGAGGAGRAERVALTPRWPSIATTLPVIKMGTTLRGHKSVSSRRLNPRVLETAMLEPFHAFIRPSRGISGEASRAHARDTSLSLSVSRSLSLQLRCQHSSTPSS